MMMTFDQIRKIMATHRENSVNRFAVRYYTVNGVH